MIRWLFHGILRDRTRSLFPFLVVAVGVALMITLLGFMEGIFMGVIDITANLDTGHLRLTNKPFYDEEHLNPLDRALAGQKETFEWLKKNSSPEVQWSPRIRWAAIMDVPNERGETRSQTPITGMAIDLISPQSPELARLDLGKSLVRGNLPARPGEMLIGYLLAETLHVKLGDVVTLIGQSFDGGMATGNYVVAGFVRFGVFAMDKKMVFIDLADAQHTFYMEDMVTDWLGFLPARVSYEDYDSYKQDLQSKLDAFKRNPPRAWARDDRPLLLSIMDQRGIGDVKRKFVAIRNVIVWIFLVLMILVLWNAGLLNGIHRYGEMGLRLALGETHQGLLFSLITESLIIGTLGSIAGSLIGGACVYYLQEVGVNMGDAFSKAGVIVNDVMRGRLEFIAFVYAIVPGMTASVLGMLVASLAIFKRSEANLFRELEVG